jgi:hypothetical protein
VAGPPKTDRDLRVRPERLSSRVPDTAVVLLLGVVLAAVVVGAVTAAEPTYRVESVSDADRVAAASAENIHFQGVAVTVEFGALDGVHHVDVVFPSGETDVLETGEGFDGQTDLYVDELGTVVLRYYDSDGALVATERVRVVQSSGL